jgi:general secretion pathway protein B
MSYILDALKKSEQARGKKKGRTLFDQTEGSPVARPQPAARRRWAYLIGGVLVVNAGFLVVWTQLGNWSRQTAEDRSPQTGIPPAPATPQPDRNPSQEAREPAEVRPAKGPQAELPPRAGDAPAAPSPAPARVSGGAEGATKKPALSKAPQNPKGAVTKKEVKSANLQGEKKVPPASSEQPIRLAPRAAIISDMEPISELGAESGKPADVPKFHELAPQLREGIPQLSVSMLIYSGKPEERWININGVKRREGDEISAGLKVEEITREGAVLNYRGRRFYKGVIGD